MVIAHHLIWAVYGWWLPNDPRGSSSGEVRVASLADLGELHHGRKAVQPSRKELRAFHEGAQLVLSHPVIRLDEEEIALVGDVFGRVIRLRNYTCYALAVMHDHVHAVIRRHKDKAEEMIEEMQRASRDALIAEDRRRGNHPVWGGPGWKAFEFDPPAVRSAIGYAEGNPEKSGLPRQTWPFVVPYDGWTGRPTWRK